jgi:hypothetical protein
MKRFLSLALTLVFAFMFIFTLTLQVMAADEDANPEHPWDEEVNETPTAAPTQCCTIVNQCGGTGSGSGVLREGIDEEGAPYSYLECVLLMPGMEFYNPNCNYRMAPSCI